MIIEDAVKPLDGMTFGADPELFIIDGDGFPVSPHEFIPGTKEEPFKVDGGAIQLDGMAAEFNIDPVDNFKEFNDNINKVMSAMEKMLPKGCRFGEGRTTVQFPDHVWHSAPDESKVLGCSPDFNAWKEEANPPPLMKRGYRKRWAGGHLHTGWTSNVDITEDIQHIHACIDLVKQLDYYIGLQLIREDTDIERRKYYGQAGSMRVKNYGVEYRTPSNWWIWSEDRRLKIWNAWQTALHNMRDNQLCVKYTQFNKDVCRYIDRGLSGTAVQLISTSELKEEFSYA